MTRRAFAARLAIAALLGVWPGSAIARAQVTRVDVESRELAADGRPFGAAGPYEILRGRVHGEVDPADRRNAIIQDLALAPRNARGRVEYVATFALARPVDMAKASGVLVYRVVNRGNGDVEPNPDGHVSLVSGWQGDIAPAPGKQTISVPVAHHPDGAPITGPVLARFVDVATGSHTLDIRLGSMGSGPPPYPPATLDRREATLVSAAAEDVRGVTSGS